MADEIDRAAEQYEVIQQSYITRTLERIHQQEQDRVKLRPMCEDCEDNPVAISKRGVHSRYCERCEEELCHKHV